MRIALVHHWLNGMRGGEKVLEVLCELFPSADIYTLFYDANNVSDIIRRHRVITSIMNNLSFLQKRYQKLFPLFPFVTEQFDLTGYNIVISSDTITMKGVITSPSTPHFCYCHTPARYAWDMYFEYIKRGRLGPVSRIAARIFLHRLRLWDHVAASRVDYFIANSTYVSRRIAKFYRRTAEVIPPPVNLARFSVGKVGTYYLALGHLVPYKRIDLLVEAFREMPHRQLIVAGDGPELHFLKKRAGSNITFRGRVSDEECGQLLQGCKALLFPGIEDFGITPLEAQACGRPVIAYGRGGVLDTVAGVPVSQAQLFDPEKNSGLFFESQIPADIVSAIDAFEAYVEPIIQPTNIRKRIEPFSSERFALRLRSFIETRLEEYLCKGPPLN